MRELKGVVPVLVTPIDKSGDVDVPSLKRLVDHLSAKPIGGLWVLGTGGEDMSLTYKQRITVAEVVSDANNAKVPLVLGAGFFSMAESLEFMNDTRGLAIDGYHAMPYHPLLSLSRIEWWYNELADTADHPLWMYTSANWARYIPPEFIAKVKDHQNIAGVKYSSSNAAHTEKVISMASSNFQVITAVVRTFYANLCLGVKAATTVEACAFAEPILEIYQKFIQGDLDASLNSQRKLNRLLEAMPQSPGQDNFLRVAEGKYILSKLNICQEYMSGYYRTLTDREKQDIDLLLEAQQN